MSHSHADEEKNKSLNESTDLASEVGSLSEADSVSEKGTWTFITTALTKTRRRAPSVSAGSRVKDTRSESSPRKESPRKESPRKESPRADSPRKNESPRVNKKGSPRLSISPRRKESPRPFRRISDSSTSSTLSTSSSNPASPRVKFDDVLTITQDDIADCIDAANNWSERQDLANSRKRSSSQGMNDSNSVYFDASDTENKYGVFIVRSPLTSEWKYYLIEKIHLLIDDQNKLGPIEEKLDDRASLIGKGTEGRVVFAWELSDGRVNGEYIRKKVAVKIFRLYVSQKAVENEQKILEHLHRCYGRFDYLIDKTGHDVLMIEPESSEKVNKKIIVQELCEGKDMMDVLYLQDMQYEETDKKRYQEKIDLAPVRKLHLVVQSVKDVRSIQDQGVTHRDIRPANAIIDHQGQVRFVDFGLGLLTADIVKLKGTLGSFPFQAPEMDSMNQLSFNYKVLDNYSLGILLIEIVTSQNFRCGVINKDIPERTSLQLSLAELKELAPDVFAEITPVDLHEKLEAFLDAAHDEEPYAVIDKRVQILIYEFGIRESLLKVIRGLIESNPDKRMSLADAEEELNRLENVFHITYENAKRELQEKGCFPEQPASPILYNFRY